MINYSQHKKVKQKSQQPKFINEVQSHQSFTCKFKGSAEQMINFMACTLINQMIHACLTHESALALKLLTLVGIIVSYA